MTARRGLENSTGEKKKKRTESQCGRLQKGKRADFFRKFSWEEGGGGPLVSAGSVEGRGMRRYFQSKGKKGKKRGAVFNLKGRKAILVPEGGESISNWRQKVERKKVLSVRRTPSKMKRFLATRTVDGGMRGRRVVWREKTGQDSLDIESRRGKS